mmetsp:Transcript_50911/g.118621  ORF Transcript_50911/g.118621 Transcript_50911/m.118621 type:complete len:361 (-) Transcript_50911:1619-2701(-)
MIGVLLVYAVVEDAVGVWHFELFASLHLDLEGVWKALWQKAPNAISVQLQGQAHLFTELSRLANEVGSRVCDNARHLHRVPTSSLAHDVAVERVQNAFVSELQRVIEKHHVLGFVLCNHIAAFFGFLQLLVPLFGLSLEHVPPVTEVEDCVDIERILTLADNVPAVLVHRALQPLVGLLRELSYCLGDLGDLLPLFQLAPLHTMGFPSLLVLLHVAVLVILHLVNDGADISPFGHVKVTTPLPIHLPLAIVGGIVVAAGVAELLRYDGHRLKPVRQNDVGIHCPHVQVVDQREVILDDTVGGLLDLLSTGLHSAAPFHDLVLYQLKVVLVFFFGPLWRLDGRMVLGGQAPDLRRNLMRIT